MEKNDRPHAGSIAHSEVRTRVTGSTRPKHSGRSLTSHSEFGIGLVCILIIVVITMFRPSFFSINTLASIGQRSALYGIMALGTVFLLSMGEIDLSVGSIYGFSIAAAAVLMAYQGVNPWLAAVMGVVVGTASGVVNGLLSNMLRIPAIIVTLGTLSMFRGLTLIVTGGTTVYGVPREEPFFQILGSRLLGLPLVIYVFALLTVILGIVYTRTRYGFVVRAIGSNRQVAHLSGISIPRVRLLTLMLAGALSGISGMMTLAFFSTADPNLGVGYELLAISAAIIGGTSLSGGSGTVWGALIGAALIGIISSAIVQFGVSANWSIFVSGAMIVLAVGLNALIGKQARSTG